MIFVILEDDYLQTESLEQLLKKEFPRSKIIKLSTEYEFRMFADNINIDKSDESYVFIIDVMMRWTDPSPDAPKAPKDVVTGGFEKAGFRIEQILNKKIDLEKDHIILYTILEESVLHEDLENKNSYTKFIPKNGDHVLIIDHIKSLKLLRNK